LCSGEIAERESQFARVAPKTNAGRHSILDILIPAILEIETLAEMLKSIEKLSAGYACRILAPTLAGW
jgi:hypothetical protein